jgi:DNA-binding transcriptional regulator YdaS (Cro superfamily)
MKLREYLDAGRGRLSALAKAIDAYPADISRWADGKRPIPVHYGWPIEQATDGAVRRQDMFDAPERIWPDISTKRNRRANDKSRLKQE